MRAKRLENKVCKITVCTVLHEAPCDSLSHLLPDRFGLVTHILDKKLLALEVPIRLAVTFDRQALKAKTQAQVLDAFFPCSSQRRQDTTTIKTLALLLIGGIFHPC